MQTTSAPSQWANAPGASDAPPTNEAPTTADEAAEEQEYEDLPGDRLVTIHERIAAVIKHVGWISKRGKNSFNNYTYVIADDIIAVLRPVLDFYSLRVSFTEKPDSVKIDTSLTTAKGEPCTGAFVTLIMKITDTSSPQGNAEFSESSGYAVDKGDKALFKAKTGARKYGYIEAFELSIGDDPEAEETRQAPQQQPQQQQRGQQQRGQQQPPQQQNRQGNGQQQRGQNGGQNTRQNPPSNQQPQQQQRPPTGQSPQNAGQAPPQGQQGQGGAPAPRPIPNAMTVAIRQLLAELRMDEMAYMNQLSSGHLYAVEQLTFDQGNNMLTNLHKRRQKLQEQAPTL